MNVRRCSDIPLVFGNNIQIMYPKSPNEKSSNFKMIIGSLLITKEGNTKFDFINLKFLKIS